MEFHYFTIDEFKCKCCGVENMNRAFIHKLDSTRSIAGVPFTVVSGYRCEKHNTEVGGKSDSAHLRGLAADIAVIGSCGRFKILDAAFRLGFNRIGIGKTFIHLDTDKSLPPQVIWLY